MSDARTFYIAGYNLPGYMPDNAPAVFDNSEQAKAYIEEVKADNEDDPFVYWIEEQSAFGYEAYMLACECENLDALNKHMWHINGCPEGPI